MATVRKAKYIYKDGTYFEVGGDGVDQAARDAAATAQATADSKAAIDDTAPSATSVYSSNHSTQLFGALYITSVACAATTGDFASVSNAAITSDCVVADVQFANSASILSDVTWTTGSGTLVLNGKCASATTADIVLVKKTN